MLSTSPAGAEEALGSWVRSKAVPEGDEGDYAKPPEGNPQWMQDIGVVSSSRCRVDHSTTLSLWYVYPRDNFYPGKKRNLSILMSHPRLSEGLRVPPWALSRVCGTIPKLPCGPWRCPTTGLAWVYACSSLFCSRLRDASMQRTTATSCTLEDTLEGSVRTEVFKWETCIQTRVVRGQPVAMHRLPPASRVAREDLTHNMHHAASINPITFVL